MKRSRDRRIKIRFIQNICFLLILTVSIVLMPFSVSLEEKTYLPVYLTGGLFWIGLIGTIGTAIKINISRKYSRQFNEKYPDLKQLGVIHFFKNTPAKITDILMVISIVGFIVFRLFSDNIVLQFIIIAVFVFLFGMHCMLNGINYIYLNYNLRRERIS